MTNKLPFYVNDTSDPANWRETALAAGEEIAQKELIFHALTMMVVFAAMNDDLPLQELEKFIPENVLKLAKEMAHSHEVGILGNSDQSPDADPLEFQIPSDKPHLIYYACIFSNSVSG